MSPPRGNRGLILSECHDLGYLIRVRCNYCRRQPRYYQPADMRLLLGNREVDSLIGRTKCEDCGRTDYTEVVSVSLTAAQKGEIRVRRLMQINIVRRPVWRDEKP